jgi:L-rhamnose isomerase
MTDKYSSIEFKTDRIVCLDRGNLHLFAEVIDDTVVEARCWVRPLAIARSTPERFNLEFLHDLRDASQLILPTSLFRDALDTEVLPLISELFHPAQDSMRSTNVQKILYQFIADLYHRS